MRTLNWLWRGLLFFVLFAFALNNQHTVDLKWFLGYQWQAPMVFIVLAAFALGCATGVLAMVPSWWRQRREARHRLLLRPSPAQNEAGTAPVVVTNHGAASELTLPPELPFPPDMPAPRKPAK
ncbi:MAG: LapA family protein [Aquabacterium sp.]|jgi:uncharacterized integral membrane protein|uniref:LapA family protein n=1 Tax=Aquabacterium sp. TaxID=1872578 RepID=UPI002A367230|nr:LapA family protein [Aquabacterium sp.]MDX9845118.1 LapA family protein [Aquabacterium sp.]